MAWASQQKTGSPTKKAVLLALANRANHDTGDCHPSVDTIAEETELGTATVKRALKDLADDGFVVRTRRRRKDGSLGTYSYEFATGSERADQGSQRSLATDQSDPWTRDQSDPAEPGTPNLEAEPGDNLPAAPDPYDPVKGIRIEGRDLAWDALAEETLAYGEANGARMKRALVTIRSVTVEFLESSRPDVVARAQQDPAGFEQAMADTIRLVAARLRRGSGADVTWGPEGIARNFARALADITSGRSVTSIVEDVLRGAA